MKLRDNRGLISKFRPRMVKDALEDKYWINAMNEEMDKIEKTNTWTLVLRPKENNVIGTKWIFINKLNEKGEVVRNMERLVCKGCAWEE